MDADAGFRLLEWDSDWLGFAVAAIEAPRLGRSALESLLKRLKERTVRLAYWAPDAEDSVSLAAAESLGGRLVDCKTVLEKPLEPAPPPHDVELFDAAVPSEELYALAIEAGHLSRFAVDPAIPREKFEALYRAWIRRSVSGEIADAVLVSREAGALAGMVTVSARGATAAIGLVSVAAGQRGRGYGRALLRAADAFAASRGCTAIEVVTQGGNRPALQLYRAAGFRVREMRNYLHFWLGG